MDERTPVNSSDFLEERIKTRPRNRRRIVRRAFEVAMLAVLFGLIACVTMVFVSPFLEEKLFPTPDATNEVEFSEESIPYIKEEILPEDMLLVDEETPSDGALEIEEAEEMLLKTMHFLKEKTEQCKRWLVEVNGVSSSVSWLESINTQSNSSIGAIIADNGTEMLILVDRDCLLQADKIKVTFVDDMAAEGYLKGEDVDAGLAVVAVPKELLSDDTLKHCSAVELATSNSKALVGSLAIAIGSSNGINGSASYGFITANSTEVNNWDINYKLITTDMYGATNTNGFLVNPQGQLLGILCQDYNAEEASNMISALGISELKRKIEHMSNASEVPVFGIKATGVTNQAHEEYDIPYGAYILGVKIDSPAMKAGIQAGDIIVKIDNKDISSMTSLSYYLHRQNVGKLVKVVIMRHSQGTYKELTLNIELIN